MVAEGSLQLSNMRFVNVTKRVLTIFYLVDSDPEADGLECSCIKATNFHSCSHIIFIALTDLWFVFLLRPRMWGGLLGRFRMQRTSLFDCCAGTNY